MTASTTTRSLPTTALLVIDVQQSFTTRPYFTPDGLAAYLAAQNQLIKACVAGGMPVVRVFHIDPSALPTDAFHLASGQVRPLEGLVNFDAAHTVYKTRHSALAGTDLAVWLTEHGVRRLIVSGIRTEQCCETTTRHASDLGWQVTFVPEATLTWDMSLPDGRPFKATDIRDRTVAVLQGRFARMASVAEAAACEIGLGHA